VQINPRTTAKDLVKMLEETGTKLPISTVKRVQYRHNLKGHSARKKPLLHKKPDYGLQLHMGTKFVLFGEMSSGLMKQKYCLATMITVMFGAEEHHANREARGWQHHVVGVLLHEGLMHFTK
jgi:hypothetical protein